MVRKAFTLVEMIVVMGILAVLLALLMPAIGKARDQANGLVCSSHLKVLGAAFLAFASDHDNCLPGTRDNWWYDWNTSDHFDWLFGQYSCLPEMNNFTTTSFLERLATAPEYGTIWPYVNNVKRGIKSQLNETAPLGNYQVYLCPALVTQNPMSGVGSNGRFDYAAFSEFDGARVSSVPPTSLMHWPCVPAGMVGSSTGAYPPDPVYGVYGPMGGAPNYDWPTHPNYGWSTRADVMPTPIICQEDARFNINQNVEGQHAGGDEMTHIHNGGSYYAAIDGSVQWVNEPDLYISQIYYEGTHLWTAIAPNGNTAVLDNDPGQFGAWTACAEGGFPWGQ